MKKSKKFGDWVLSLDEKEVLAVQNLGVILFIVGIVIAFLFVHYIDYAYIAGIVITFIGAVIVGVCEKILDYAKEIFG